MQVFGGGKDALRADKTAYLKEKGEEGREINEAERSKKEPARNKMIGTAVCGIEQVVEDASGVLHGPPLRDLDAVGGVVRCLWMRESRKRTKMGWYR